MPLVTKSRQVDPFVEGGRENLLSLHGGSARLLVITSLGEYSASCGLARLTSYRTGQVVRYAGSGADDGA